MASTRGSSVGWSASVCAPTSELSHHTASVRMVTRPSCTSCQPATLAWPSRSCRRTRRAPSFSALRRLFKTPRSLLPSQTAPSPMTGGHFPLYLQDSTGPAIMVRTLDMERLIMMIRHAKIQSNMRWKKALWNSEGRAAANTVSLFHPLF